MLLPLEAYFSHHKDGRFFRFSLPQREEKLCCSISRYMTQVFFLSLVTSFVHPPPSYWIKQGKKSIGHKVGHSTATLGFLLFEWIYTWTLSSFPLENFVLDAMLGLRNMEVLWQTQKASQAYFKCGQNFYTLHLQTIWSSFWCPLWSREVIREEYSKEKSVENGRKSINWK